MAKKRIVAHFMHEEERQAIKEQNRSVEFIVTNETHQLGSYLVYTVT